MTAARVRRGACAALATCAALAVALAAPARSEWMQPDASVREAQMLARLAARDTAGHGQDAARLDSLGAQLLRLARLDEAQAVYGRALETSPRDGEALAALGKIALFRDRLGSADSLLIAAGMEPGAAEDRVDALVRRGDYANAATLADQVQQQGRAELLRAMAATTPYRVTAGPGSARVLWQRTYPVPLVRVRINGESMLMALDTGAGDVLLDPSAQRRCRVRALPAQRTELWMGARVAVKNAMMQRLEIGGMRIEDVPAGVLSLRKWSLNVNPYGEQVAGVIGIEVLRRFATTIDWKNHVLELRRATDVTAPATAPRVPFEWWGANELTVYGSINGGRRMAMVVESGVPLCGVGAPPEVFEEVGIKPGMMSRLAKGAGQWLQGRPWSAVVVPAVTLGPIASDKLPGWSGALDPSELWRHGVRRDALLGGEMFRDRRVTFDWQGHALIVED